MTWPACTGATLTARRNSSKVPAPRLPVREVLYLKAEQKYVTLRTAAHAHVLDDALSDLELRLGAAFVRIHRNALLAVLPVSRRQVAAVRVALAAHGS